MENMQESLKQAVDAIDNQAQIYENLIDYLSYRETQESAENGTCIRF